MFGAAAFVLGTVGAGVLARHGRAAGDDRRGAADGARLARAPQPPPLRRLHRPPRHGAAVRRRRGVVGVRGRARRADAPGRHDAGRRLHGAPTSASTADIDDARRPPGGHPLRRACCEVQRDGGEPFTRGDRAPLLSRRRDPQLGPVGRFFEGEATSEIGLQAGLTRDFWAAYQPDQESIRKIVDGARQARWPTRRPSSRCARRSALAALLRDQPPAGDVPPHRLAARVVDLARRDHRLRRRPARPVAGARRRAPQATARAAARVAQDLGRA